MGAFRYWRRIINRAGRESLAVMREHYGPIFVSAGVAGAAASALLGQWEGWEQAAWALFLAFVTACLALFGLTAFKTLRLPAIVESDLQAEKLALQATIDAQGSALGQQPDPVLRVLDVFSDVDAVWGSWDLHQRLAVTEATAAAILEIARERGVLCHVGGNQHDYGLTEDGRKEWRQRTEARTRAETSRLAPWRAPRP